jgi:hypothetical protein
MFQIYVMLVMLQHINSRLQNEGKKLLKLEDNNARRRKKRANKYFS